MKKIFLLLPIIALLSSCWGEEEVDFNPNNFTPVVQNLSGPAEAIANGFGESVFSVLPRAGSTFEWTVTGASATVTKSEEHKVVIVFAESAEPLTATVSVVETAFNGKTSEAATTDVALAAYCPLDASVFTGTPASAADDCGYTSAVTVAAGTGSTLVFDGIMDDQVEGSWGETYDAGVGNEGNVEITLNEDGTVDIPSQHMGTTENGTWEYWIRGSGTYDQCNETMTIDFTFGDSADDYYNCTLTVSVN